MKKIVLLFFACWVMLLSCAGPTSRLKALLEQEIIDYDLMARYINQGADVNIKDKDGKPLLSLLLKSNPEIALLVLKKNVNVNQKDVDGNTCFNFLTTEEIEVRIKILTNKDVYDTLLETMLQKNADLFAYNNKNASPFDNLLNTEAARAMQIAQQVLHTDNLSDCLKIMVEKHKFKLNDITAKYCIRENDFTALDYHFLNSYQIKNSTIISSIENSSIPMLKYIFAKSDMNQELVSRCLNESIRASKYGFTAFLLNYNLNFSGSIDDSVQIIAEYLDLKDYTGDKRVYTRADLKLPDKVSETANAVGVSPFVLLRNELYARHGYIFKAPLLAKIFSATRWYKPVAGIMFANLSKIEQANQEYILNNEEGYINETIAKWLDEKGYFGDTEIYNDEKFYRASREVVFPLHHINLNASRVLRNEILARRGYIFADKKLQQIFEKTRWYKPRETELKVIINRLNKIEQANIELMKNREWIEILDSMKQNLPADIRYIPVVGYNSLLIKSLTFENQPYFYSSHLLSSVLNIDASIFKIYKPVDDIVPADVIEKIKNSKSYQQALVLYFENKKYYGYTDSTVFRHADMQIPDYLIKAMAECGTDWRILLRKEIHARHGAIFTDPIAGKIFAQCSWFNPRYNIDITTASRLPAVEKFTEAEITNFALLEGEELAEKLEKFKDYSFAVDLNGNTYFIKIGYVDYQGNSFIFSYGFESNEEYKRVSIPEIFYQIIDGFKIDSEQYQNQEDIYEFAAC